MKLTFEELFQNSFVISCNDNQLTEFNDKFNKQCLPLPRHFSGIHPKCLNLMWGNKCDFSHYALVKMAKTLDLPFITIFEDDATPMNDLKTELTNYLQGTEIPDDCDIFIFGNLAYIYDYKNCAYHLQDTGNKNMAKVSSEGVAGAHAYIVFKRCYDKYLNVQQLSDKVIAADGMFATKHTKDIVCYSSVPSFFIQCKQEKLQYEGDMIDKNSLYMFNEQFIETIKNQNYDVFSIVIMVGPNNVQQANLSQYFVSKLYPDVNKYVVASNQVINNLIKYDGIQYIDENQILDKEEIVSLYRTIWGTDHRFEWYYQQFLKLLYYKHSIENNYVIFDGDTVPLTKIDFLKNGCFLINKQTEYWSPYFDCMKKLLNLDRQVDYSFISNYLIMNKTIVEYMVNEVEHRNGKTFIESVLTSITPSQLPRSGFSEFETYGNYVAKHMPNLIQTISLSYDRMGQKYFNGRIPSLQELEKFQSESNLNMIAFEEWYN